MFMLNNMDQNKFKISPPHFEIENVSTNEDGFLR